jgi:hypothetical protein
MIAGRTKLLADPRLRPGMKGLWDLTSLDLAGLSDADIRALASGSRGFEQAGLSAAVVVAPRPLSFGLLRMFDAYVDEIQLADRFTIVETMAEAYVWLADPAT